MSENYVKKYDVGQIKLDLPYAHYIHELPLLSFGDVQHTINLSLIYQSKLTDNPYKIATGYKLSLQKRLIFAYGTYPKYLEEGDGTLVELNNLVNNFTFKDDSQRIIRYVNGNYVLEYPDYSKEIYHGTTGKIIAVYDKYGEQYLSYTYQSLINKLSSVQYRDEKTINLYYDDLDRLSSIEYVSGNSIFTTTFTYSNNDIIVKHYSEVDFHLETSDTTFNVYSSNRDSDYSDNYSHQLECFKNDNSITVNKTIGTECVDTITYDFVNVVAETEKVNLLDVRNKHDVTTRIQFENDKPAYSYEVTDEINNEVSNNDIKYTGKVAIYNNNNIVGYQSYLDGYKMTDVSNDGVMHRLLMTTNASGYFILSGWVNAVVDQCEINIRGNADTVNADYNIPIIKKATWQYFSVSFKANAFQFINVSASPSKPTVYLRDLKITFQEGVVLEPKYSRNISLTREVLIQENSIGDDIRYFVLNDNDDSFHFYNGDNQITQKITAKDIWKYKLNQKYSRYTDEIYCNSCYSIIPVADTLNIKYEENGNTYTIPVTELAVGTMSYVDGKKYITKTNYYTVDNSIKLISKSSMNDVHYKEDIYDEYFDLIQSTVDGITTTYDRNSKGLIESQIITNNEDTISIYTEYDPDCTKILSTTDEFGETTEYTTDDIWGVITEIKLPNQIILKNNYDKDKSVLIEKEFGDRRNSLDYSNGNLEMLATGNLKYIMSYTDGYMTGISKYNPSTTTFSTIESHIYSYNSDGETTVFSQYPSSTSPLYTDTRIFDKYGRLKSIDGVFSNAYDIWPSFDSSTGNMVISGDNGSALLAMTTDLIRNEISRYKYSDKGQLIEKIVTDKNDYSNIISGESFEYDSIGRLIKNGYISKNAETKVLGAQIKYLKGENDPLADNKIDEFTYISIDTDNTPSSIKQYITEYEYNDPFHRLSKKTHNLESRSFTKEFTYDKTRIERIVDSAGGTISYTYDDMGRIESMTIGSNTTYYTYDEYGQLVREDNQALDKTFQYEYNGIGNITKAKTHPYTAPNDELSANTAPNTHQYEDTSNLDYLTKYGYKNIEYNDIGYPVTYGHKQLDWENGKLTKYYEEEDPYGLESSESTEFTYNCFGQRVRKEYSYYPGPDYSGNFTLGKEVTYDYDHSGRLIREVSTEYFTESASETIELIFLYDESGMIGFVHSRNGSTPQAYYYQRNLLGDVVAIYNTSGTKVASYTYDAWGNCTSSGSMAPINPIRYRGYYFDKETGWYYLNARYYSPEFRRFISPDDTAYLDPESVNGLNLYCYCNNDPINYADPSGHFVISSLLIAFGVGAVLGGIYGGISAAENGQNVWAGIAIGAIVGGFTGLFAEAFSLPGTLVSTFIVGAAGDYASQRILDHKSHEDVNINSMLWAGVSNALLAGVGKVISIQGKTGNFHPVEKILFDTITNSPLLALGMVNNMIISKHSTVYTIKDLRLGIHQTLIGET